LSVFKVFGVLTLWAGKHIWFVEKVMISKHTYVLS